MSNLYCFPLLTALAVLFVKNRLQRARVSVYGELPIRLAEVPRRSTPGANAVVCAEALKDFDRGRANRSF